mmetsp:Transcript_26057/g.43580  ORF Transcript_26057/g.43580 Transcript_26057/m.43580 type:complete len:819 (-) Transcript_26057:79-2535(-)
MAKRLKELLDEARSQVNSPATSSSNGDLIGFETLSKIGSLKNIAKRDATALTILRIFLDERKRDIEARSFVLKNLKVNFTGIVKSMKREMEQERLQHAAALMSLRKQNAKIKATQIESQSEKRQVEDANAKAAAEAAATAESLKNKLQKQLDEQKEAYSSLETRSRMERHTAESKLVQIESRCLKETEEMKATIMRLREEISRNRLSKRSLEQEVQRLREATVQANATNDEEIQLVKGELGTTRDLLKKSEESARKEKEAREVMEKKVEELQNLSSSSGQELKREKKQAKQWEERVRCVVRRLRSGLASSSSCASSKEMNDNSGERRDVGASTNLTSVTPPPPLPTDEGVGAEDHDTIIEEKGKPSTTNYRTTEGETGDNSNSIINPIDDLHAAAAACWAEIRRARNAEKEMFEAHAVAATAKNVHVQELEAALKDAKESLRQEAKKHTEFERQMAREKTHLERLISSEKTRLEQLLSSEKTCMEDQLRNTKAQHEQELKSCKETFSKREKEMEEELQRLNRELETANADRDLAQKKQGDTEKELAVAREKTKKLEQLADKSKRESKLEARLEVANKEVERVRNDHETTKKLLNMSHEAISHLEREKAREIAKIREENQYSGSNNHVDDERVKKLREQMMSVRRRMALSLKEAHEQHSREIKELKALHDNLSEDNSKMKKECGSLREENEQLSLALKTSNSELVTALQRGRKMVEFSKQNRTSTTNKMDTMEQKVHEINKEYEAMHLRMSNMASLKERLANTNAELKKMTKKVQIMKPAIKESLEIIPKVLRHIASGSDGPARAGVNSMRKILTKIPN